jgi:hypothetical protein
LTERLLIVRVGSAAFLSYAQLGHGEDGIEEYREGLELCGSTENRFLITIALGWGAEAFIAAGQSERALRSLDMGLALAAQNGEQFWVAELRRQAKGQCDRESRACGV